MRKAVMLAKASIHEKPLRKSSGSFFFPLLLCLIFVFSSAPLHAEQKNYNAPEGNISTLIILERAGFSRVYGLFTRTVGRIAYDDQTKILDNVKIAALIESFTGTTPDLATDLFSKDALAKGADAEVAFVQSEPVRFDGTQVKIKGELVMNGMRKPVVMDATLNKFGRMNQSTDVNADGPKAIGLTLHGTIKRSDFGLSINRENSPYGDDIVLMFEVVAQE